ncbi:MAG TPA: hypothetical protein VIK48_06930, partial [Candidatus Manganitrophaceae bacterium]
MIRNIPPIGHSFFPYHLKLPCRLWVLLFGLLVFFSGTLFPLNVDAINLDTRTVTVSAGMGINNGANRDLFRKCSGVTAGATIDFSCGSSGGVSPDKMIEGSFGNTTDPFNPFKCSMRLDNASVFDDIAECSGVVDPELPITFLPKDTQFGRGVPCGPDDPNGPPFPYPCSSDSRFTQQIPGFVGSVCASSDCVTTNSIQISSPTLGPSGAPFQSFVSTPTSAGGRVRQIKYGFDQTASTDVVISFGPPLKTSVESQTFKIYFTVDSETDANGRLVGSAIGAFTMAIGEIGMTACQLTPADPAGAGSFTGGEA